MNIKLGSNEDLIISTKSNNTVTVPDEQGDLYIKPSGGIPASDLSSSVQQTLNNAGSASKNLCWRM